MKVDDSKVQLYIAIGNLIKESLSNYNAVDVDDIHESFTIVLDHVKTTKQSLVESVDADLVNEDVIEIAVNKYNEKYESLTEEDKTLLQKLIKSDDNEKEKLLEEYKSTDLRIMEEINSTSVGDWKVKAIQKINEMKFSPQTVDDDIIGLHELKKDLI